MKQVQKILFTSHTANFSKFNRPLMRDLRAEGYEVDYASAGEEKILDADRQFQVDFPRSPFLLHKVWRSYRQLRKLLKAENYALIHCHTPVGGVVTRLAARKLPAKVVYTGHGFHFYKGAPWTNWLFYYPVEKILARKTDCLITINSEDYALAKRKFRAKRLEYIEGAGVDLTRFQPVSKQRKLELRQKHRIGAKKFVLIYVAELNKNKDQEFLIRSLPELVQEIPQIELLLVSAGKREAKLKTLVGQLGLEPQVKFLGYRRDVDELYQLSDLVVSASLREGLGLNVIEGMASGLPAVIRDNRGHRDIIRSEKDGVLFHNRAEFVAGVKELYENPKRYSSLRRRNAQIVKRYDVNLTREKMQKIYHDLLK